MYIQKDIIVRPVSLEDMKRHLRIYVDSFDADLEGKIDAATEWAERYCGMIVAAADITVTGDLRGTFQVPGPVRGILSAKKGGEDVPSDGISYSIDGTITLGDGVEADEVIYNAGLEKTPDGICQAIMLAAAAMWENPTDSVHNLPTASESLLRQYRLFRYGN